MFYQATSLLVLLTIFLVHTEPHFNKCLEKCYRESNNRTCDILKFCSCWDNYEECLDFYNDFKVNIINDTAVKQMMNNNLTVDYLKLYMNMSEPGIEIIKLRGVCSQENQSRNNSMASKHLNLNGIQKYMNLAVLALWKNCISEISGSFSASFPRLQYLFLNNNQMKFLSKETLKGSKFLIDLYLDNNSLSRIDGEAFKDLQNLQTLYLDFNELTSLPSTLFYHTPRLTQLTLTNNYLKTLPETIFKNLSNLQELSLMSNRLYNLPPKIFEKQKQLVHLFLGSNNLKFIDESWFLGLHSLKLLNIENNLIDVAPNTKCFQHLKKFTDLDLKSNKLKEIPELIFAQSDRLEMFEAIDISNNNITTMILPLANRLKATEEIDLSNNCFTTFDVSTPKYIFSNGYKILDCVNCCLTTISHRMLKEVSFAVNFTHNLITELTEDDFNNIPDRVIVDLRYNKIRKVTINVTKSSLEDSYYNPKHVSVVLDSNPFVCDCSVLPFLQSLEIKYRRYWIRFPTVQVQLSIDNLFCGTPANLKNKKVLNLKNEELLCDIMHKDGCPQKCSCQIRPYDNTMIINCRDRMFETFPDIDKSLFKHSIILYLENNNIVTIPKLSEQFWIAVSQLHLSHNQLMDVEHLEFGNQLTVLSIDNNRLTKIEKSLVSILSSNLNVDIKMAGNLWICDCELVPQRPLIYSKNVLDINETTCSYKDGDQTKTARLTELTDQQMCPFPTSIEVLQTLKIAIPMGLLLVIVFSSSVILFRRYQSQIKLWLFVHGICLKLVSEDDIDADKTYDAFVSYSYKDENWVMDVLVKGLEDGTPAYRLCLHERDWIAGEYIPDQIARSVEQSRRTIIVLTQNFVESYWSQMEFYAAYQNTLKDNLNRLIVVVPDEIPTINTVDRDLNNFVSMNTYLMWNQPNFWNKLHCAMPRVRYSSAIELRQINT